MQLGQLLGSIPYERKKNENLDIKSWYYNAKEQDNLLRDIEMYYLQHLRLSARSKDEFGVTLASFSQTLSEYNFKKNFFNR